MKKLIEEYKNQRGKLDLDKIKGHKVVFNFNGKPELLERKVVDGFEGYIKFQNEWVALKDINLHFVIEESVNPPDLEKLKKYSMY